MRVFMFGLLPVAFAPNVAQFDINTILTYLGLGAGGVTAWKIVSLLLDKIVPSRTDKRNDVEASFSVLSKTIEILSTEKASDSAAIGRANARIKELEADGSKDYDVIRVLKEAKTDLETRIAQKDRHIAELAGKLAEFGASVSFDGEGHLKITSAQRPTTGPIRTVA